MPVKNIYPLAFFLFLCTLNLFWFLSADTLMNEAPVRIVLGALFVFLFPGLIWGEVLRLRSRHLWETIALAFSLTLVIELLLLSIPFFCHAPIGAWVALLFAVCFLGLGLLAWPATRRRNWDFLAPLVHLPGGSRADQWLSWSVRLVPLAMTVAAYLFGEKLLDVGGEKMLHLLFVRYYHDMPLSLHDIGVRPGLTPPNLINLWEFLIAAWARCIQVEPLFVFFRARFVIPILGLSGLYLLLKMIFLRRRKTETIFFAILLMCVSDFLFISPTLKWVKDGDFSRGVMAFMGTVHHADPAIDILIALSCGLALLLVRRPSPRHAVLFLGILVATFLWHPREFLQLALYLGILGLVLLLIPAWRKKAVLKNWIMATSLLFATAFALLFLTTQLISSKIHTYDEIGTKKTALQYAVLPENLVGVRNLFNFPYHCMLSPMMTPDRLMTWQELNEGYIQSSWHLDYWLLLSGFAIVVLGFYGRREDRGLALYYFCLWFLALGWNFSMLVILAMTYSEFYMVSVRLLYLFSYIVIADLLFIFSSSVAASRPAWVAAVPWLSSLELHRRKMLLMLAAGLALWGWQRIGSPGARPLSLVLSYLMLAAALWTIFGRASRWHALNLSPVAARGLLICCFFVPFLVDHTYQSLRKKKYIVRAQPAWFTDDNPFGFSEACIAWLRTLPRGQNILVNPDGRDCLHAYAPQYSTILPVSVTFVDLQDRRALDAGTHPLLVRKSSFKEGFTRDPESPIIHGEALKWLDEAHVNYLLLNHEYYENYLHNYVRTHSQNFQVVFHNPSHQELIVRYMGGP